MGTLAALLITTALSLALDGQVVVSGAGAAPGAWALVTNGDLWVCWHATRPTFSDCWRRVAFELEFEGGERLDTQSDRAWGLEFAGPRHLRVRDPLGDSWSVRRGHRRPRRLPEGSHDALPPPPQPACGPALLVPSYDRGVWRWRTAPACPGVAIPCAISLSDGLEAAPLRRFLRRPRAISFDLSVEFRRSRGWFVGRDVDDAQQLNRYASADILVLSSLGFDFPGQARHQLARVGLLRRRATRAAQLPPVPAGPLADEESAALHQILCRARSTSETGSPARPEDLR